MEIIEKNIDELIPYENNPRKNDEAVEAVANSIREFGFKVPVVIDKDNVVVAGHTRIKAARELGIEQIPCIVADDLTEEQIKAYRLADNKVAELAGWDFGLLDEQLAEITEIDMEGLGFRNIQNGSEWFENRERGDTERQEGNEEYNDFLDKFEQPKTTDDCYTPDTIYEALADWVAEKYGMDRANFVRPFYPGGDYQKYNYKPESVVVDNPPFSILSEILNFYKENHIRFFLFCQGVTAFSSSSSATVIACGVQITYENGAQVNTSFLTNMEEDCRLRTDPELYKIIDTVNTENEKAMHREIPKYSYPAELVTAAMCNRYSKYGIEFKVKPADSYLVSALDAQKEVGKSVFGKGYLLSEKAAAEKAAAEKAAAEKAAAEVWTLSDRERAICAGLGG